MLATMVTAAVGMTGKVPLEPEPWIVPILAILTILFGGGGVAAIMKARSDKKIGVAQADVAEDDSIAARWERIIKAQTESLVGPLQARLADVEGKVRALEEELVATRTKYWRAVKYIRNLMTWITVHIPADDSKTPPAPPTELVEDL